MMPSQREIADMQPWFRGIQRQLLSKSAHYFTVLLSSSPFLTRQKMGNVNTRCFFIHGCFARISAVLHLEFKKPWRRDLTKTENFGGLGPRMACRRRENSFSVESFRDRRSLYNPLIERDIARNKKASSWSRMTPGRSKNGGRWETRTLDLIRVKDAF